MDAHSHHHRAGRPLSRWRPGFVAAVANCLLAIAMGLSPVDLAAADSSVVGWCSGTLRPSDAWNTLTVDMSVKRGHLTRTGETTGAPSPTASYRIERSSRSGAWKTAVTVLSVDRPPMYSLSGALMPHGPFPVARVEDDENGTPIRAYGPSGALLQTSQVASDGSVAAARTVGLQWLDAFVATGSKKASRQQAFERMFGKATKVGSLSRYLRTVADGTQEVLVDPKVVVPVESNAVRSGKLVGHRTFTYGPAPDAALVRTAVHAETVTDISIGERAVVDTTFSRVCLEQRR